MLHMKTTHSPVLGRLWQAVLVAVFTGDVSCPAVAQDVRGDLVKLVNPYTVIIDVKGKEQTIVGNPPGTPGVRATMVAVKARCTIEALPKGGLVVFRGKLDWTNFYEIAATDLRLELGDKPVDSYMEGTIQSKGKAIGTVTYAYPARPDSAGRTTPGGVATRELSEDTTLEIAGYVVSTKPLVVQVTPEGMTSIFATVNNKQTAAQKVAGAKFKVLLKEEDEARVTVDLGRAVHLAGERPTAHVWLDKATGAATQITLNRRELIVAEDLKAPSSKKAPATKKTKPAKKAE